jgi:hypothetical protein
MNIVLLKKHIKKFIETTKKIDRKTICTIHISYIYKYFSSVCYNLKHSDSQSGTLQSGYHHTASFISENSKIKTNNTPTAQNADNNVTVNS